MKKTKTNRIVPLSDFTLELLTELRKVSADPVNGYALVKAAGRQWIAQTVSKRMESLRRRGNIPPDAFVHGLRKSAD